MKTVRPTLPDELHDAINQFGDQCATGLNTAYKILERSRLIDAIERHMQESLAAIGGAGGRRSALRNGEHAVKQTLRLVHPAPNCQSDGGAAAHDQLPDGATQLQDLIRHRNMNPRIGQIFRLCYRYGHASRHDALRDARMMLFHARAEVERLERES